MKINEDKPIFIQIQELIRGGILNGAYPEETQIPSITELSVSLGINPATALKGVTALAERGLLYKKRGLGMYVAAGAKEKLKKERKDGYYADFILPAAREAVSLGIDRETAAEMIKKGIDDNGNNAE